MCRRPSTRPTWPPASPSEPPVRLRLLRFAIGIPRAPAGRKPAAHRAQQSCGTSSRAAEESSGRRGGSARRGTEACKPPVIPCQVAPFALPPRAAFILITALNRGSTTTRCNFEVSIVSAALGRTGGTRAAGLEMAIGSLGPFDLINAFVPARRTPPRRSSATRSRTPGTSPASPSSGRPSGTTLALSSALTSSRASARS